MRIHDWSLTVLLFKVVDTNIISVIISKNKYQNMHFHFTLNKKKQKNINKTSTSRWVEVVQE